MSASKDTSRNDGQHKHREGHMLKLKRIILMSTHSFQNKTKYATPMRLLVPLRSPSASSESLTAGAVPTNIGSIVLIYVCYALTPCLLLMRTCCIHTLIHSNSIVHTGMHTDRQPNGRTNR